MDQSIDLSLIHISAVFNEALNTVRVEEAGLDIPKLDEVTQSDEKWALVIECQAGETLETVMEKDPDNLEKYMAEFVDLQLQIHAKTAPMLTKLKDKLAKQINQLKELDATQRYELLVRLESMPKHTKVCHGDFNPSNVIVGEDGKLTVVDLSLIHILPVCKNANRKGYFSCLLS